MKKAGKTPLFFNYMFFSSNDGQSKCYTVFMQQAQKYDYSFLICTNRGGICAGNSPSFRIMRCPSLPAKKEAKPRPSPFLPCALMI